MGRVAASWSSDSKWVTYAKMEEASRQNAVWIAGVILLVLWVWALLPGGWFSKKRMDWRLALGAAVIPALVLSAPAGPIANLSQLVVGGVSSGVSTLASSFLRLGGAA